MISKMKSNEKGFTLYELLIVVLIISILLAAIMARIKFSLDKAKNVSIQSSIQNAASVLHQCSELKCKGFLNKHSPSDQFYVACAECDDPKNNFTLIAGFPIGADVEMTPNPLVDQISISDKVSLKAFIKGGSQTFCYYAEPAELQVMDGLDFNLCSGPTSYP